MNLSSPPFACVVADPPWRTGDSLPGKSRGAAKNYATLSTREIALFRLPPLAPDAFLFLWRISCMVEEAYCVARSWGFVPKTEIVWQKTTSKNGRPWFGMGRTVRASHETCIVATRGRPEVRSHSIRSTFSAPFTRHSGKPDAFFGIVEQLAEGPYVELFARRQRDGWTCLGLEAGS